VKLGQLNKLGRPVNTAVSPDGKVAAVLSIGDNPKGFYATYLSFVQLKPSIKLITSKAVSRFGSERSPPKAPYYLPGGFVLAIGNANQAAQHTVFLDAVVGTGNNCTQGYIVPLTYDRKRNKLSDFKSRTATWLAGTDCPVVKPPLPTITQTAAMVGSSLYLIQNMPAQDILAQDVLKSISMNGVIKSAAVFNGRGSPALGDCYTYLINDATSFFAICEVKGNQLRLSSYVKGKAPKFLTTGSLQGSGRTFRLLATSPKNTTPVYIAFSRAAVRGKSQPDLIVPYNKATGKAGKSFGVPKTYVAFTVVP
jgi:hypothetical protein